MTGFHSVCPLMDKDKKLMEASWWERLTEGETGSCSDGQDWFPSLLFDLRPNYGRGNEGNSDHLQKVPVPLTLQQATVDPCLHGLLDTYRQAWISLLWGQCSFLLGPGVHKVLFVPCKSLFPQSCESSVIKSHWPPKSNSLGVLNPFVRFPGWEICCGS